MQKNLFLSLKTKSFNLLLKIHKVFHLASLGKCEKNCALLHQLSNKFGIDPFSQVDKNFFGHTPYDLCKLNNHDNCLRTIYKIANFRRGILSSKTRRAQRQPQKVQINLKDKSPRLERAHTELALTTTPAFTPKLERINSVSSIEVNLTRSVLEKPQFNEHTSHFDTPKTADKPFSVSSAQLDKHLSAHKSSTETLSNSVDFSVSDSEDYTETNLYFRQAKSLNASRNGYSCNALSSTHRSVIKPVNRLGYLKIANNHGHFCHYKLHILKSPQF